MLMDVTVFLNRLDSSSSDPSTDRTKDYISQVLKPQPLVHTGELGTGVSDRLN